VFTVAIGIVSTLLSAALMDAPGQRAAADWSTSPEGYFLTMDERQEWKALRSDEAREQFKDLYWSRRDPSPGTPRNEFKDAVLARIRRADAQFTVGKKRGSETAEGFAYVVFGAPSIRKQTMGPLKTAPEMVAPGQMRLPNEAFATTEWHTWIYDRDENADLLGVLGAPSIEIAFVVEPGHRDELQNPSRVQQWRELVARHSILRGEPPK
jgi:GWxTD domain-containing protein